MRVPFGENEGRTIDNLAEQGEWGRLFHLLSLPAMRAHRPSRYLAAWRRCAAYMGGGGRPPDVWKDPRGNYRFLTVTCKPGMDLGPLPANRKWERALLEVFDDAASAPNELVGLPRKALLGGVVAKIPLAAGARDRRWEIAGRALRRLVKRGEISEGCGRLWRLSKGAAPGSDLV